MRDIDDWMFHFERQVTPGLKTILTRDLNEPPPRLTALLEKLRRTESKEKEYQPGEPSGR